MSIEIDVQQKLNIEDRRKITKPEDVYNLKEVQEIKNALQEHLLLVGLNNANKIRSIRILGIGSQNCVMIPIKDIIRTAMLTTSEKVILVHNHPSGTLNPSKHDIDLTFRSKTMLEALNIEFLDHLIVTEEGYTSIASQKMIKENSQYDKVYYFEIEMLKEENKRLKQELEKIENNRVIENDAEEELEM